LSPHQNFGFQSVSHQTQIIGESHQTQIITPKLKDHARNITLSLAYFYHNYNLLHSIEIFRTITSNTILPPMTNITHDFSFTSRFISAMHRVDCRHCAFQPDAVCPSGTPSTDLTVVLLSQFLAYCSPRIDTWQFARMQDCQSARMGYHLVFRLVHRIAKNDYWLRHVCASARSHGTARSPVPNLNNANPVPSAA